jgi:hypothetical protein
MNILRRLALFVAYAMLALPRLVGAQTGVTAIVFERENDLNVMRYASA